MSIQTLAKSSASTAIETMISDIIPYQSAMHHALDKVVIVCQSLSQALSVAGRATPQESLQLFVAVLCFPQFGEGPVGDPTRVDV